MDPSGTGEPARRYFFLHVMKTAGTTFSRHILRHFPASDLYPTRASEGDMKRAYLDGPRLLRQPPERLERVRLFQGHYPYAVVEELGLDLVTMTLLRDPVARTLSMMRQLQSKERWFWRKKPAKIYESGIYKPWYLRNHQTKIFSMRPEDGPLWITTPVEVDEHRLQIARENVAKIDVLGITERFSDFLDVLRRDYGWRIRDVPPQNVSGGSDDVPPWLIERIREENAYDVALYEYARELCERRRADRAEGDSPVASGAMR